MKLGRVISSEFAVNRDGENPVLLLQVELSDPDDIQTVEYLQAAGVDYRPPADTSVIVLGIGTAWQIAIAADDGVTKDAVEGEMEIYSSSGGSKLARVKCDENGHAILNNGDDYAVAFNELKAAFDDLQQQWNTFAAEYVPGSPTVTGTPPTADQSTVSIDPAKVDTVRVP